MKGRNDCEMLRGGCGEEGKEGAVMSVCVSVCVCCVCVCVCVCKGAR